MNHKIHNQEIVAQIVELIEQIKLEGESHHDGVMFFFTDRSDKTNEVHQTNVISGCPCNIPLILKATCEKTPDFNKGFRVVAAEMLTGRSNQQDYLTDLLKGIFGSRH